MAELGRRPSRWWLAWLVALLIIHFITPLGTWIGTLALGDPASTDVRYPYVDAFAALATVGALYLWVRLKEGRPFTTVGFRPRGEWTRILVGFGVGAGMACFGVVLGLILGVYENGHSTHPVSEAGAILALLPLIALQLLLSGTVQALTSGYMLQSGARQLPAWVAVIATSIIFAMQQTLHPLTLLNLILFGTFAGLVALQQGSLWLVVGLQAGWNCCLNNVFGLPVGGLHQATALFSIRPAPDVSTAVGGGYFGLDTGLLATIVMAAATIIAYLRLRLTAPTKATSSPAEPALTPAQT